MKNERYVSPDGNIILEFADCMKIEVPHIDVVISDPPYHVLSGKGNNEWDILPDWNEWFEKYSAKAHLLFGQIPASLPMIKAHEKFLKYDIIWEKNMISNPFNTKYMPAKIHESIFVFYKENRYEVQMEGGYPPVNYSAASSGGRTFAPPKAEKKPRKDVTFRCPKSVQKYPKPCGKERIHSTQKPLELLEWLVKSYSNESDVVCDPFSGGGTTAVACINTGRKFWGCEFTKEYFDASVERIKRALREKQERKGLLG